MARKKSAQNETLDTGIWFENGHETMIRRWTRGGLEAARVNFFVPTAKELSKPYVWSIWLNQETGSESDESGRAASMKEAQSDADKALQRHGYTLR